MDFGELGNILKLTWRIIRYCKSETGEFIRASQKRIALPQLLLLFLRDMCMKSKYTRMTTKIVGVPYRMMLQLQWWSGEVGVKVQPETFGMQPGGENFGPRLIAISYVAERHH